MKSFKGINILVTAGPTREYIDPVRYISNDSSGIMGLALVNSATRLNASVTLIHGPLTMVPQKGVRRLAVVSAGEMFRAVKKNYGSADIIIMAAAVSDFRPAKYYEHKLKKTIGLSGHRTIELVPNPDILSWLGKNRRKNQVIIGFALETKNLIKNARKKLLEKKCDMIVANYSSAIGQGKSSVKILTQKGVKDITRRSKPAVAKTILNQIGKLLPKQLTAHSGKL
jgi:phosphopantothenoylcysteine synthetase/decarboxylase